MCIYIYTFASMHVTIHEIQGENSLMLPPPPMLPNEMVLSMKGYRERKRASAHTPQVKKSAVSSFRYASFNVRYLRAIGRILT